MSEDRQFEILLADNEAIIHATIGDYLRTLGHHVQSAHNGSEALEMIAAGDFDAVILDLRMPGMDGMQVLACIQKEFSTLPVVMITGHGNMQEAIRALRLGAADFLTKPVQLRDLETVLERCTIVRELREGQQRLRETIEVVQQAESRSAGFRGLVGCSDAIKTVRHQIDKAIAARCMTILLTGETGVGKEVVARELHAHDHHGKRPFIAINCPAIPDTLVESEFFGHVKGAFTGANESKAGCFELADGGTLLLDEIADLSALSQAKLLRVLETRTVRRVGAARENGVSVCVVAATNAPLEKLVSERRIRQDLFYRLNVFRIDIPPLRDHKEDIPLLAEHFLRIFAESRQFKSRRLSPAAQARLLEYDYPGNVRELRNVVERAAIMRPTGVIEQDDIQFTTIALSDGSHTPFSKGNATVLSPEIVDERSHIRAALEKHRWNRRRAAQELGLSYSGLRYKINRHNLK